MPGQQCQTHTHWCQLQICCYSTGSDSLHCRRAQIVLVQSFLPGATCVYPHLIYLGLKWVGISMSSAVFSAIGGVTKTHTILHQDICHMQHRCGWCGLKKLVTGPHFLDPPTAFKEGTLHLWTEIVLSNRNKYPATDKLPKSKLNHTDNDSDNQSEWVNIISDQSINIS